MNTASFTTPPVASPFRPDGVVTLAEVVRRIDAEQSGAARRDALSAFRLLEARLGLDLAAVVASPAATRAVLAAATPGALGVAPKSAANIRSLAKQAIERFGMRRQPTTVATPLAKDWRDLLDRIEDRRYRWPLSRLARYCSFAGVAPTAVNGGVLRDLHDALEAECFAKKPRLILKQTIGAWNHCRNRVDNWPDVVLGSPFKTEPDMMPFDAFPESFRAEVAEWSRRMTTSDPFDPDAPVRALRPATVEGYRLAFRRAASSLVRSGAARAGEVTGFAIFFEADNFTTILRRYHDRRGDGNLTYVHKLATQLRNVARQFLKVGPDVEARLDTLVRRLAPADAGRMGRRHLDRLEQFDDPAKVHALLAFPEEEAARARAKTNPLRRAKGVERALAISLLIHVGLRIGNLRRIRLDTNVRRAGRAVLLSFSGEEMKTRNPLTLELPDDTAALLDEHLAAHRVLIPGAYGPYLFPSPDGGPRSTSAMRYAVSKPVRTHAGIEINPHLYRHVVAKVVIEQAPDMAAAIARRLGQKSINTAFGHYLGTEARAANRAVNRMLGDARIKRKSGV